MIADRTADVTRLAEVLVGIKLWGGRICPDSWATQIAALLAPVVDELARQRAADELETAAAEVRDNHGTASLSAKRIDARVTVLRGAP